MEQRITSFRVSSSRLGACLALAVITAAASPQVGRREQEAVDNYRAALAAAESRVGGRRIEAAFAAIVPLRNALMRLGENGLVVLESLADADYRELERALRGVIISREENIVVQPDAAFFLELAQKRGDRVDRRFFEALAATYPNSLWPAYIEQQTDYSGCTAYGGGTLVEAYRRWSAFKAAFPGRYVDTVDEELSDIEHELTESTCACGDAASVVRELEAFVRTFPRASIVEAAEQRLADVRAGRSKMRTHCHSG